MSTIPDESRQPAGLEPKLSSSLAQFIVQIERGDRGPTDRRKTQKTFLVVRPSEMLTPDVLARMKERNVMT